MYSNEHGSMTDTFANINIKTLNQANYIVTVYQEILYYRGNQHVHSALLSYDQTDRYIP